LQVVAAAAHFKFRLFWRANGRQQKSKVEIFDVRKDWKEFGNFCLSYFLG
jgi:hypothetical protein